MIDDEVVVVLAGSVVIVEDDVSDTVPTGIDESVAGKGSESVTLGTRGDTGGTNGSTGEFTLDNSSEFSLPCVSFNFSITLSQSSVSCFSSRNILLGSSSVVSTVVELLLLLVDTIFFSSGGFMMGFDTFVGPVVDKPIGVNIPCS